MATQAEQLAKALVIKNETVKDANTATRVGTLFEDIVESNTLQDITDNGNETTNDVVVNAQGKGFITQDPILFESSTLSPNLLAFKNVNDNDVFISAKNDSETQTFYLPNESGDLETKPIILEIATSQIIALGRTNGTIYTDAEWNATYTTAAPVAGGNATLLIDTTGQTVFPTVTGATLVPFSPFVAGKTYAMRVWTLDGVTVYYKFFNLTDGGNLLRKGVDDRPEWDNGTDWKGLAYRDEVVPSLETGTVISFANPEIYNSSGTPATTNITNDLTGALQGVVQKIYHNHSVAPTVPAGWVLMGAGTYVISELNVIYAEFAGGTRVEYWIVQEQ